jgi:hypothetical protein
VLTHPLPQPRRRRPLSLRQEYEQFLLERIEDYKNQLSRGELLALADEAVRELEVGPDEQLVLTEVLMLEHVDRLITRRLRLPSYRRWRERHTRLRRAQRDATHWGLPSDLPLANLVQRMEDGETAVVVGAAAAGAAFFLAAYDADVVVVAESVPAVDAIEARAAQEALATHIQALVVMLGEWFPDVAPALAVLDPGALSALDATARIRTVRSLQERTARGGAHLILPADARPDVRSLAPEALAAQYPGWVIERGPKAGSRWLLAVKP